MTYKLGKTAAIKPFGLGTLGTYVAGRLPVTPTSVSVPTCADWGMMDNDRLGDCTIAGVGHIIVAANIEVQELDAIPNDAQISAQYMAFTGGQDVGCNESVVLREWYKHGLFGKTNKIAGYAPVNMQSEVHTAIAMYGACYVGVQCPESAQEQFQANEPWTVVPDSPIEGGHCIVFVGYDPEYLYAVTWGGIAAVSYPWWATYGDEAWAVISQEFNESNGNGRVNLPELQADLNLLR